MLWYEWVNWPVRVKDPKIWVSNKDCLDELSFCWHFVFLSVLALALPLYKPASMYVIVCFLFVMAFKIKRQWNEGSLSFFLTRISPELLLF